MDQDPRNRPFDAFPSQNTTRRTAGSGSGTQMPQGDSVRDWQRNTWYGPAPTDFNPFDEPEDAPELRASRSDNVNQKVGNFWEGQNTGYQYTGAQQKTAGNAASQERKPRREISFATVMKILGGLLSVVLVVYLVLRFAVFTVREIRVVGNGSIPSETVITQSGIHLGESMLSLDQTAVQRRIEDNYSLQFRYLEKNFPSTVVLCVREREVCCWITYSGILYFMDKNRMVMYETEDLNTRPAELVEVKGLNIRAGCRQGQTVLLNTTAQEMVFNDLFLEMKVLGCTAKIAEADLSNLDSLILVTRAGYTVFLGDEGSIHAKLRAALLVQEELLKMNLEGGTINVTNPETPVYSPPPNA